jgi:hypothetical protein
LQEIYLGDEELLEAHDTVDPLDSGFVTYKTLCSFIALKKYHPDSDSTSTSDAGFHEVIDDSAVDSQSDVRIYLHREKQEIRNMFQHFTRGTTGSTANPTDHSPGQSQPSTLTLTHLRGVKASVDRKTDPLMLSRSQVLHAEEKEGEDPDADLKTMISDANMSEDKSNGWRAGVTFEEFEEVMRRLPMFTDSMDH